METNMLNMDKKYTCKKKKEKNGCKIDVDAPLRGKLE